MAARLVLRIVFQVLATIILVGYMQQIRLNRQIMRYRYFYSKTPPLTKIQLIRYSGTLTIIIILGGELLLFSIDNPRVGIFLGLSYHPIFLYAFTLLGEAFVQTMFSQVQKSVPDVLENGLRIIKIAMPTLDAILAVLTPILFVRGMLGLEQCVLLVFSIVVGAIILIALRNVAQVITDLLSDPSFQRTIGTKKHEFEKSLRKTRRIALAAQIGLLFVILFTGTTAFLYLADFSAPFAIEAAASEGSSDEQSNAETFDSFGFLLMLTAGLLNRIIPSFLLYYTWVPFSTWDKARKDYETRSLESCENKSPRRSPRSAVTGSLTHV